MPDLPPLLPTLPQAQVAFTRKYANPDFQSSLSSLPVSLRNSLIQFDLQRVARGQQPLSATQTLGGLQSFLSNQPATPPPDQSFLERLGGDIRSFVSEVPKLPITLFQEATQLPEAPGKLSEVLGRGGTEAIAGLSEVPGLRLIPGVFTVSQIARNGPAGALEHPLFTALDVLPYAKPAIGSAIESTFSRLPSVEAARATLDTAPLNAAREAAGLPRLPEPSSLRLFARESPTLQTLSQTRPAQLVRSTFGNTARDIVQVYQSAIGKINQWANPDAPTSVLTTDTAIMRDALKNAQDWQRVIPPDRISELTKRFELDRNDVLNDPTITDPERAYVNETAHHVDTLADFAIRRGWMKSIDNEMFPTAQANTILRSRRNVARFEQMVSGREAVQQSLVGQTPSISDETLTGLNNQYLTQQDRVFIARGYAHALSLQGYDTQHLFNVIRSYQARTGIGTVEDIINAFRTTTENPPDFNVIPPDEILNSLQHMARNDPSAAVIYDQVKRGNYQEAIDKWHGTFAKSKRAQLALPQLDDMLDSLKTYREANKYLDRTSQFSTTKLESLRKSNVKLESNLVPARFQPLVEQTVKNKLYSMFSDDAEMTKLIDQGFYSRLGLDRKELNALWTETRGTWKNLRDLGYDPIFVHRVNESLRGAILRPSISDIVRTPSQIKVRTGDVTPYIEDATVALSHQAMEFLNRMGQEHFTQQIIDLHGRSYADVENELFPVAQTSANPKERLDQLIKERYAEYDPHSIFPESIARYSTYPTDKILIPRQVEATLKQLFHDGKYKLSGILDPIMKVFRTSLLPLSPRWHFNNLFGGAMMATAVTDPFAIIKYFNQARDMVKSGELHLIEGMPPSGFVSFPADIEQWAKSATTTDKVLAIHQYKVGAFIQKLWQQSAGVRDKAGALTDSLYRMNGLVDDFYRSVAYLYGHDKTLTKGLTESEAQQAGVALVRKTMQSWDRITPIERNVIRFIFPFYGWANHILRFAYRYPIDHPYRTGITSSLARIERDDFGNSLPSRFLDAIFLGHPDANGNITTLSTTGINPFRDVANYFTLAGFTGQLNPVIQTLMESIGVDPSKGAQDLYPEIAYDPVTGRLRPQNKGLLSSFIGNVFPQSELITALIGQNQNFKEILRTNPDAAAALLRSSVGLPTLFRSVNPSQEVFKAELQREQLQSQVRSDALRTGDWSKAQAFPQLRTYFAQLQQLLQSNPDALKAYQAQTQLPSTLETLGAGVVGSVRP